jgi:hypothetical protein
MQVLRDKKSKITLKTRPESLAWLDYSKNDPHQAIFG